VYTSTDGTSWIQITITSNRTAREEFTCLVFNNELLIIGGAFLNDVWGTTDGADWTQKAGTPYTPQCGYPRCCIFENKIWLTGFGKYGNGLECIYSSDDGANWNHITNNPGWNADSIRNVVVFNNKMYCILNDEGIWSSSDGVTWQEEWSKDFFEDNDCVHITDGGTDSVVFKDKIWFINPYDCSIIFYPYIRE
jgi:hypothetical protein